jgi:hypothetical protein
MSYNGSSSNGAANMQTATFESGIIQNGELTYNIQVRRCEDGSVQQRHIWHAITGQRYDPPQVDKWLSSWTRDFALATRNMRPVEAA